MAMTRKWFNEDGTRMDCLVDDCTEPVRCSGLCNAHYQNFYYMSTGALGRKRYNVRSAQ